MIHYFVTKDHYYTVTSFLKHWGSTVLPLFKIIPYEHLDLLNEIDSGLFVFSDLDRLTPLAQKELVFIADLLVSQMGEKTVFNHPADFNTRLSMLETLYREGVNSYRAFPLTTCNPDCRFPIFLRMINDHEGPVTGLLHTLEEYRTAVDRIASRNISLNGVMVVEFCNTKGQDGLFRKYSAFCIGEDVIPWHVIFSDDWVTKDSKPESLREEEAHYLLTNPHQRQLRDIFRLAKIRYGRIDYGIYNGKLQVWEINTNPTIIYPPRKYAADKRPLRQAKVMELNHIWEKLHSQYPGRGRLNLGSWQQEVQRQSSRKHPEVNINGLPGMLADGKFWFRKYRDAFFARLGMG